MTGWTPPIVTNSEGRTSIKLEIDLSYDDNRLANYKNKALHAIFNGYDAEHIKLISSYETANKAWDILQTMFEDSSDVK